MKKNIEQHLKSAFQEMTPDCAEELWNRPVEKACGNEWYLDGVPVKRKHRRVNITMLSAVAACFVLCTAMYLYRNLYVESIVYIDVNPSIELQTNTKQEVVRAKANNADGEKILEEIKLEHTDVDTAFYAIFGAMVKQGYLNEKQHTILLSIEGKNQEKADSMCKALEKEVDRCVRSLIGTGTVYAQQIQSDAQMEQEAKKYGISPGKANFIHRILEKNPQLDFGTLAKLSIEELGNYIFPEENESEEREDAEKIKEQKEKKQEEEEKDLAEAAEEQSEKEKEKKEEKAEQIEEEREETMEETSEGVEEEEAEEGREESAEETAEEKTEESVEEEE